MAFKRSTTKFFIAGFLVLYMILTCHIIPAGLFLNLPFLFWFWFTGMMAFGILLLGGMQDQGGETTDEH